MRETLSVSLGIIQESGMFAPLCFIFLHLVRQFMFIPVGAVCVVGGALFGAVLGTIYSIIGIILTSVVFYVVVVRAPSLFKKIMMLKERWLGHRMPLSLGQITILRLVPFVHFHMMSLYIMEMSNTFKEYMKLSLWTVIPLVVMYTAFGHWMSELSFSYVLVALCLLATLFYVMRRKEWIFGWEEFFSKKSPQE